MVGPTPSALASLRRLNPFAPTLSISLAAAAAIAAFVRPARVPAFRFSLTFGLEVFFLGILMMATMTLAMSRERGAPSKSVDLGIIAIARRSIQSSPDPYAWSALRTRTRKGIPLAGAPLQRPCAAPYCAPDDGLPAASSRPRSDKLTHCKDECSSTMKSAKSPRFGSQNFHYPKNLALSEKFGLCPSQQFLRLLYCSLAFILLGLIGS